MENISLQVNMLGVFSIRCANQEIQDSDNRSHKVWLLLAYLIYYRKHTAIPLELPELLWGDNDSTSNLGNALKTMLHRARTALNQLYPSAGHDLILRRQGKYVWNTEYALTLDIDEFESLCKAAEAADNDEERIALGKQALALYGGDFLSSLSSEVWVVSIASYYHQLYLRTARSILNLLASQGRWDECEALCRDALKIEPYDESLYCSLMRALMQLGRQQEAALLYEEMSDLLLTTFGVMPSDESRSLYRKAMSTLNNHAVPATVLAEQLMEADENMGALFCDYDFFKVVHHSFARSIVRSGDAIHILLFSMGAEGQKELARRSLDHAMDAFKTLLLNQLRRGDIVSQCSISQYVALLPQADFENSRTIATRIVKAFSRQYPHSPAQIQFSVLPISPAL